MGAHHHRVDDVSDDRGNSVEPLQGHHCLVVDRPDTPQGGDSVVEAQVVATPGDAGHGAGLLSSALLVLQPCLLAAAHPDETLAQDTTQRPHVAVKGGLHVVVGLLRVEASGLHGACSVSGRSTSALGSQVPVIGRGAPPTVHAAAASVLHTRAVGHDPLRASGRVEVGKLQGEIKWPGAFFSKDKNVRRLYVSMLAAQDRILVSHLDISPEHGRSLEKKGGGVLLTIQDGSRRPCGDGAAGRGRTTAA